MNTIDTLSTSTNTPSPNSTDENLNSGADYPKESLELFCGGIGNDISKEDIKNHLSQWGEVDNIR